MARILKKTGLQLLVFILLSSSVISVASAATNQPKVMVNNSSVEFGIQSVSGRTMVPLKAFESFKNTVLRWDVAARKATIARDSTVIELTVGKRTASVNAKSVPLDAPAKIVNGRVTVPLRFISEALGARVTVDAVTKAVWIQERASEAMLKKFNSSDLVASRIAALRMPVDESQPSRLTGDNEALSATYYFPKGKSDSYYVVNGHFVRYYEIREGIQKAVWEANLDNSKDAVDKDITAIFGYPIRQEYGTRPPLSDAYAFFYTSVWGSQIIYGIAYADKASVESGRINDWSGGEFIVALPGEKKL